MSEYSFEVLEHDEETIDFRIFLSDFWKELKKHWWLCGSLLVLGAVIYCTVTKLSYVPMFQSVSVFTVSVDQGNAYEGNDNYGYYYSDSTANQMAKTFPYILKSDMLTNLIMEDLNVEELNGSLSVSALEKSNLFTIRVTSDNPEDAKDILDSVIRNYPAVSKYVIGDTQINMIEPAQLPQRAYNRPIYWKEAGKGAIAGLMLSMFILIAYALNRHTIHRAEELKEKLNLAYLGDIPAVCFKQRKKKIDKTIFIRNNKVNRSFKESLQTLTIRIQKAMEVNNEKILMLTSTLPQEGKTTISLNLAFCLAGKGKRVVLLDTNLRRPALWNMAPEECRGKELSQLLEEGELSEEYLNWEENGPLILGNRNSAEHGMELLGSASMKNILQQLSENFDYVLLDTASVKETADSIVLAESADAAIYVVKQDCAEIWDIMDGLSLLSGNGVRIAGCILSQVQNSFSSYGYGYGYGKYGYRSYGYRKYGYGVYGETDQEYNKKAAGK